MCANLDIALNNWRKTKLDPSGSANESLCGVSWNVERVACDNVDNNITMDLTDNKVNKVGELELAILDDVFAYSLCSIPLMEVRSINGVLMMAKSTVLYPARPKQLYLDMHTTRNLYFTSSSLGSFNTISKFNCDCIIKKIPVIYNYNEMLFDSAEAGYDYLDIGRKTISCIDIQLLDSMGMFKW